MCNSYIWDCSCISEHSASGIAVGSLLKTRFPFSMETACNKSILLKKKKKVTPKSKLKQIHCLWSSYKQAEVLIYWSIFTAEMNYTIGHATVKSSGNCNKKNQRLSLNCEGCWQMSRKRYGWCQTCIKDWFNSQSNCYNCLFFFFFSCFSYCN